MAATDRIFGAVVMVAGAGYVAGAFAIRESFLQDPVGPRTFPILIGSIAFACGALMAWRPDAEPDWPGPATLVRLAIAAAVTIAFAYALKPLGFILPGAVAAAALAYMITPRAGAAVLTGVCLSVGLFVLFRYVLGLSLPGLPGGLL
jgi:putative tricarboxylic transport membrane protein